jgi:hypothetical protein
VFLHDPNTLRARAGAIPSGNDPFNFSTDTYANVTLRVTACVYRARLDRNSGRQGEDLGTPNLPLTSSTTGFINGDDPHWPSGTAALSTAPDNSNAGQYPITAAQGSLLSDYNYGFWFVNGPHRQSGRGDGNGSRTDRNCFKSTTARYRRRYPVNHVYIAKAEARGCGRIAEQLDSWHV